MSRGKRRHSRVAPESAAELREFAGPDVVVPPPFVVAVRVTRPVPGLDAADRDASTSEWGAAFGPSASGAGKEPRSRVERDGLPCIGIVASKGAGLTLRRADGYVAEPCRVL